MLGRRRRRPGVLAEVRAPEGDASRPGALGRAGLAAYSRLAAALADSRAVLVSGPAKSAAALGLAAAATAEGRRVALLECDLATPALAGTLGLSPRPGLHEYLREEAEAAQILQPLVLAGPASGRATKPLACIVAGEPTPTPVGLLDSERCDHAIEKLRRAYELLVIDGPPLSEDPDALRALAEHATTTIVCGGRAEIPKRLPLPVAGLVLVD
jgi:MinD-like ATPase involved in chromosome partitioning or flagellar assembly